MVMVQVFRLRNGALVQVFRLREMVFWLMEMMQVEGQAITAVHVC